MTNDQVSAWLDDLGLGQYRETFKQNAIDWDVLPDLSDGDLGALGVLLGHRKKLLRAIASLSQSAETMGRGSRHISVVPGRQPFHPEPDQAERRQLTVMFCDLVDSTALSRQLDPEDLQDIVRRFLDTCSQAIGRFEGYIARYMGDGMLVYFGYPHAHEDDAERAVHSGLAILDGVKALNRKKPNQGINIAARIGIATGQVVVGELLGQETAKERSAFGACPNLAARLQGLAKPDQLIIDPTTKRLVGRQFRFGDHGTVSLKGFETPVQAWQVLSIGSSASRFEAHRSAQLVNFIGREDEVSLLYGRWREVVGGEGQVLLLSGEAGIGKSRIIQILCDRIADEHHNIIRYQCSPYHTNTALYPAINYLRQAAGFASNDSSNAKLDKLNVMAFEAGVENQETGSLIADLLSIRGDHRNPPSKVSSEKRKEMTLEALVHHVQSLAARCSVLFIVEDAHWIDPTTRDLLTRIIDHIQQIRVLLLITFRPDFKPVWSEHSHVTSLTLSRLPRRHCTELVSAITGGKTLPPEVQQAILAKTDGVPLYLEELTKNVLESGVLTEEALAYTLKATLKELSIPESLQASLMERLDRFAPIRGIVQAGAAIGREFSYALLQAIVKASDSQLRNGLDLLVASGLIFQEGDPPTAKYLFKHALVQEAAYSTILHKTRQLLHARIGKALESRFAERVKMEPELLAYHYEQAGLPAPAVDYWHLAARRAAERSANIEALNHFDRALHLLKELPKGQKRNTLELELLIGLGAALTATKGYGAVEVEQTYVRSRELCREMGDPPELFPALRGLAAFYVGRARYETALELGELLLALAQRTGSDAQRLEAHLSLGGALYFRGDFASALTHIEQVISCYDPARHHAHAALYGQDPSVLALGFKAVVLWFLGQPSQALSADQLALTRAQEMGHRFSQALALCMSAYLHLLRREAQAAESQANATLALANEYEFAYLAAEALIYRGWALTQQFREKDGIRLIREGLAAFEATGAVAGKTAYLAILAEACARCGQDQAALNALDEAFTLADQIGENLCTAELHRLKGELLLRQRGAASAAESYFVRALDVANRQGAKSLQLRAAVSLARLWADQGKRNDACELLKPIYGCFTEGFETLDLREARDFLGLSQDAERRDAREQWRRK